MKFSAANVPRETNLADLFQNVPRETPGFALRLIKIQLFIWFRRIILRIASYKYFFCARQKQNKPGLIRACSIFAVGLACLVRV
jgi:hypothetical protein